MRLANVSRRAFLCSLACIALIPAACTVYKPSLRYPKLEVVSDLERKLDCAHIDVAIDRADTVRWLIRDDGGRLETSAERSARYAGNVIVIPFAVLLHAPGQYLRSGHDVLDAADGRIRELLELKRERNCPPRATALAGLDEFAVLTRLEAVQARLADGKADEASLFSERMQLLDGLRVVPPPRFVTRDATAEPAATRVSESLASGENPASSARDNETSLPPRMPRIGDTWSYRYTDLLTKRSKGPFVHEIVAVSDDAIREHMHLDKDAGGTYRTFTRKPELIEQTLSGMPDLAPYLQAFDALRDIGSRKIAGWIPVPAGPEWTVEGRVLAREMVEVPAGRFDATRAELTVTRSPSAASGANAFAIDVVRMTFVLWYAPEVKRVVKCTRESFNWNGRRLDSDMYELLDRKVR